MSDSDKTSKKKGNTENKTSSRGNRDQNLLQALGISQEEKVELEKKLSLAVAFDSLSEHTFNFIYKDQLLEKQLKLLTTRLDSLGKFREEDKLLKQQYEAKQIKDTIYNLKSKAEQIAASKGYEKPFDRKYRNYNLLITIPIFGVFIILIIIDTIYTLSLSMFLFPLLCVAFLGPRMLKGSLLKKWHEFKEENKNQLYTENREDHIILKEYTQEILRNVRETLLEKKIPLQIIKFQLLSSDYEDLKVLGEYPVRNFPGEKQLLVSFEYPPGMEPFPIPEGFKQLQQSEQKPEKNFVVLTELKAKNGIISDFLPSLKDKFAKEINEMLNNSELVKGPDDILSIIPNYSEKLAVYCPCREIVNDFNIQICNWKDQFKFYLFVGETCKCGETIYALSLIDENDEIPDELKIIFSN
ncbi:MAG: hypothetical protein ACFFBP_06215 [Promethearchaeota archaeon]